MTALPLNLGAYEILHALKAGGMGEVLLARRRGLEGFEQLCAIKTIRPELATAPLIRAMFLDEARLLARLTHPAIAHIIDFGEQGGVVYMVMEYVAGEHFRRFGERRPPPAIVCQAVAAACRGLHAAHELRDVGDGHLQGLVHRDISPDNLMVGYDGRVKILDFGIALVKGRKAPATEVGVLKGKPPYMSPEQLTNQELDRRADIFSIAVVLHELLTGRHLFNGDSIYAIVHAVEHQVIVPPSTVCGPLPDGLDDVVLAGLERNRDHRLASAAAMAEVLERIVAQSGGESLEAWAERELAIDRESHRRWMSGVVGASGAFRLGRVTGVQTAVGDTSGTTDTTSATSASGTTDSGGTTDTTEVDPARDEAIRATQLADVSAVGPATASPSAPPIARPIAEVVPTGELAPPAARRRTRAIVAALTLAALGVLVIVLVLGRGDGLVARPPVDAGVDALVAPPVDSAAPAVDALAVLEVAADAAVVDARQPRDGGPPGPRERRDAAPLRVDGGVAAAAVDAGPVAFGYLTTGPGNVPSVNVTVDGVPWPSHPFLKKRIPVGRHRVTLLDPFTGEILHEQVVDIVAGKEEPVFLPPAPRP